MKGRFSFSKEEKLTGKSNIDQLFNEGKSFNLSPFRVIYRFVPHQNEPVARIMIAIPKKKVRRAVDRNRLRRLVREAYRLHKAPFISHLESIPVRMQFAIVYVGEYAEVPYNEVEIKITACLDKLCQVTASGC